LDDLGFVDGFPVEGADFESEGDAVNGFFGGIVQEPGDVEDALLVLEDGGLVVEGEMPVAEIAAEGVAGWRRSGGSGGRVGAWSVRGWGTTLNLEL
jgi:hypothetical protein